MTANPNLPRNIRNRVNNFIENEGARDMSSYHARQQHNSDASPPQTFAQRAGLDASPAVPAEGALGIAPPSSQHSLEKAEKREKTREVSKVRKLVKFVRLNLSPGS